MLSVRSLTVFEENIVVTVLAKLDPVSRLTGIPGWYWILAGIKCSDTTGVGLVY